MEMTEISARLVEPSDQRGIVPHRLNPGNDLPVQRGRCGESYFLTRYHWNYLTEIIDKFKPQTSWSTRWDFTFSIGNPLLSPYLQRAANLAMITISYFSDVLPPFSSKIVTGVSTAWEVVQCGEHCYRGWRDHSNGWLLVSLMTLPLFMLETYFLWPGIDPDNDQKIDDMYSFVMLSLFQSFFFTNCFFAYFIGKAEYDLKLQLENLQQLLKEHPELETHLELLHNDPTVHDNAFIDLDGKPLLFPFYQVVNKDTEPARLYLTPVELHMLLKTNTDPSLEIYCDKVRFKKVLTIFKQAQEPPA